MPPLPLLEGTPLGMNVRPLPASRPLSGGRWLIGVPASPCGGGCASPPLPASFSMAAGSVSLPVSDPRCLRLLGTSSYSEPSLRVSLALRSRPPALPPSPPSSR
ncbi:hypothetical protein FKM82_026435 [Ascaphus truei]